VDTPPRFATKKDAELIRRISFNETVLERTYDIRENKTVREERLAEVRRREREALSIKELVG
jgi:hypothetical protein